MFGGKDNFGGKGPPNTMLGGYGGKSQAQTSYGGKEMQQGGGYTPKMPYGTKTQAGGYAGKGDPSYGKGQDYDGKGGYGGKAAAGAGGLARMGMSPGGVQEVMSGRLPSMPSDQHIALAILRSVN